MADAARNARDPLALFADLAREPYAYGFFQALRLLEAAYPDRPLLGRSVRASRDPIRLAQEPSLGFAPSTLASFSPQHDAHPAQLRVFFFGLFGPHGPLPLHLTEYARDRRQHFGDSTMIDFADLFHHRMLSLFYRAWADARPTVQMDRPESERFSAYVGSLFGLGISAQRERDSVPDEAKLFFAGRLSNQRRSAEDVQAWLTEFFELPVEIEPMLCGWQAVPEVCRFRLGESKDTGTLGVSIVLGERSWESQERFRVRIGPLSLRDYERLLPEGPSCRRLQDLVRLGVGRELGWQLNLVLARGEVPKLTLGGSCRLGLTSWLSAREPDGDPDDFRKEYQEPAA